MARLKVHWIKDASVGSTKIITHCGMEGWRAPHTVDEYDTGDDRRLEAVKRLSTVTCGRCLQSAKRLSNAPYGYSESVKVSP